MRILHPVTRERSILKRNGCMSNAKLTVSATKTSEKFDVYLPQQRNSLYSLKSSIDGIYRPNSEHNRKGGNGRAPARHGRRRR